MRRRFCHDQDHLPEEIWEQVLLRLPPKFLIRFKCVCKSWYAAINNPLFIKKQLHFSMENNKHSSPVTLCFSWTYKTLSENEVFTGRYKDRGEKQVLSLVTIHKDYTVGLGDNVIPCVIEEINLPFVLNVAKKKFPVFSASTHCNGILCFYDYNYRTMETNVSLCNIQLGEFKLLHTPRLHHKFIFSGAGFGYDPRADDYKFVKLFYSLGSDKETRALVHTLGTNSWRIIDLKDIYGWLNDDGVYCKGFYYWWNGGLQDFENFVLSFDLSEETFCSIQLPPIARVPSDKFKKLTMWNESVAFIISIERSLQSTSFEMWVMVHNFNGVEGLTYWNKHLTIGPLVCIHSPLAFWKDDELLLQTRDGRIVSYNLHTQKIKELSIPGSILPNASCAFSCLKTLVSVKNA